jgi:RNA polymerase sigma factor (sigma-70 family)
MPDEGSVTSLLVQLHAADPAARQRAVSELVGRYTPELLGLITARMQERLRQRVSPEDILQDVLFSFCDRHRRGEYDLANRDQFLSLIVTIALNKLCSASRRELRQRRDLRREQRLHPVVRDAEGSSPDPADPRAGPDVAAEVAEEVERLLGGLPAECREVALLRVEGRTVEEIARQIDRTPRTVERRLERIRELWRGESQPGSGGSPS